ncbi:MAG TPA: ABC transporter ATP-binding protein [Vicinamibacterales bacterium]
MSSAQPAAGSGPLNAIEVRDVRKTYRRYGRRKQFATLKSALLSGRPWRDLQADESFEALKGVSFDVRTGRTFGIVGRNGSGKSTLLKMIAGIGRPTSGSVRVNGRVSALIELGAGFHPEISARENVFINGMMLGMTRREMVRRFDEIVAFAELEDFIDAPVKTYSSGMYMRLGFAVAIHVDPDVLLVDEVLAVGDEAFKHKCLDKLAELRRRGRTVLFVTHQLEMVTRFCDEALWLDGGIARQQGDPQRVVDAYLVEVAARESRQLARADEKRMRSGEVVVDPARDTFKPAEGRPSAGSGRPGEPADMFRAVEGRWGSREVEIVGVSLVGASGEPANVFQSGERVEVRILLRAGKPVGDVVVGIGLFNAEGTCCYGTNTHIDGASAGEIVGDGEARFVVDSLDLVDGTYKLDVAVHRENGTPYDYHRLLYTFRVTSRLKEAGIFRPPHTWSFSGGLRVKGLS